MLKYRIEYYIRKILSGEAQENALAFAAYLRANDMLPVRFKNNYWKDKCAWAVEYRGEWVFFILLNGSPAQDKTEPEGWVVWTEDRDTNWYEDAPIDERMKEIAWRHVDFGTCGSEASLRKIIFGKEFEPVCGSTFRFNNPSGESLECAEKMAELRINDILRRHSI